MPLDDAGDIPLDPPQHRKVYHVGIRRRAADEHGMTQAEVK